MTIEQYLADLLVPEKWEGKTITPVLAETMGDGKLLAEVTPIGSRPKSWYILIDSSYLLMAENEQDEYEDEIHAQIESNFGRKWLTDFDKKDKEIMHTWTKREKKNGYKDYPAYEWDGGSIEIINVNEFIQEIFISELLKIGFELSSQVTKHGNEIGAIYIKQEIEFHLFDDWFRVYFGKESVYSNWYEKCEIPTLMEFIANEVLKHAGIYILDVPKNIYDFKYLYETYLPFTYCDIAPFFERLSHVVTKTGTNYLLANIVDSTYLLIGCEMKDIVALEKCKENVALLIQVLKGIVTNYNTCIVCKFIENDFTEIRKINSKLAIKYL
jgi:hypothetical protein